jgi:prefoldin subunit 5
MSEAAASATGHDATVSGAATDAEVEYLATREDELARNIEKTKQVIEGAKRTQLSLRDELKQVSADLKAARAGRGE